MKRKPGEVRDAIVAFLNKRREPASLGEIRKAVDTELGTVSPSSVRSYLNLNEGKLFRRTGRGCYKLVGSK